MSPSCFAFLTGIGHASERPSGQLHLKAFLRSVLRSLLEACLLALGELSIPDRSRGCAGLERGWSLELVWEEMCPQGGAAGCSLCSLRTT